MLHNSHISETRLCTGAISIKPAKARCVVRFGARSETVEAGGQTKETAYGATVEIGGGGCRAGEAEVERVIFSCEWKAAGEGKQRRDVPILTTSPWLFMGAASSSYSNFSIPFLYVTCYWIISTAPIRYLIDPVEPTDDLE